MGVEVPGEFGESLRTVTLTCPGCQARNERDLPYDMTLPDKCYACGHLLCNPDRPRANDEWIQTYTGRRYWPLDPRACDVCLEDIAHHLAMLCRFTGACKRFYPVAEHAVHVSHVVEAALAVVPMGGDFLGYPVFCPQDARAITLIALHHDDPEYVCNDIARPVKRSIVGYEPIETANWVAIAAALALPDITDAAWKLIKQADEAMLIAEQEAIMGPVPAEWAAMDVPPAMLELARYRMVLAQRHGVAGGGSWERSKLVYLLRHAELTDF